MKIINLSKGYITLVADDDYEWLNQWKWAAIKGSNTYYAMRNEGPRGAHKIIYTW